MSMHERVESIYLKAALEKHGLSSSEPSQLSDAFRCGWDSADLSPQPKVKPLDDADFFMIETEATGFCRANEGSSLTYAIMKATERRILSTLE